MLLHGKDPIPGARANETLAWLDKYKIPYIFFTNGGGKTEQARVDDLNQKLGTDLTPDSFVQSHTPFAELVDGPENLRHKTVLVTGSDYQGSREVLHKFVSSATNMSAQHITNLPYSYGFQSVVTPGDIWKAYPAIFPFVKESEKDNYAHLPPLPKPIFTENTYGPDTNLSQYLKVEAIFILNDVRDWALDYQIFSDLLLSHQGYLGTYSKKNEVGLWQQDGQTKLYFSNADLVWGAAYHLPRYGQGSTKASLEGLWRAHTGGHELVSYTYGKPTELAYRFAERQLRAVREKRYQREAHPEPIQPLRTVYMVGDNPDSDIAGPNTYKSENGTEWHGLLVKTGVYDEKRSPPLTHITKPLAILENVHEAVGDALRREGIIDV